MDQKTETIKNDAQSGAGIQEDPEFSSGDSNNNNNLAGAEKQADPVFSFDGSYDNNNSSEQEFPHFAEVFIKQEPRFFSHLLFESVVEEPIYHFDDESGMAYEEVLDMSCKKENEG